MRYETIIIFKNQESSIKAKEIISKIVNIDNYENTGKKKLAYDIKKDNVLYKEGYYVTFEFDDNVKKADELKLYLKDEKNVLKSIVMKIQDDYYINQVQDAKKKLSDDLEKIVNTRFNETEDIKNLLLTKNGYKEISIRRNVEEMTKDNEDYYLSGVAYFDNNIYVNFDLSYLVDRNFQLYITNYTISD